MRVLKYALVITGLVFLAGAYPLTQWHEPKMACEQMLGSVYAALGVFLLLAARNPFEHGSLIAFTGWSSVVHSTVMIVQGYRNLISHQDATRAVAVLLLIGITLIILTPGHNPASIRERGSR